jgi:anaerobic selenocysteine-containing dehydrogenase
MRSGRVGNLERVVEMVESRKNICLLCSLGCGLIVDVERDEVVNLEYDTENRVNRGKLCAKGNYIQELLNHPLRLDVPMKDYRPIRWEQAAAEVADALRAAQPGKTAAVVLSGDASCEDVELAVTFATNCTAAGKAAISFPTGDDKVVSALAETSAGVTQATLDNVEKSVCTIAVGDPFARCPVIAGRMLAARNAARANSLNVVSREDNMTSRFAATHLAGAVRKSMLDLVAAVAEASGGAKEKWLKQLVKGVDASADAQRLAKSFVESERSVIVLSTDDPVVARLANGLVKAAGDTKRLFTLHDYGNVRGILEITGGGASTEEVIESAGRGEIDVLLVLGADLVSSYPDLDVSGALSKVKLLVAGAPFGNKTTDLAGMVLPTALWLETDGTFNGVQCRRVVDPPGGATSYGEILKALAKASGVELPAYEAAKALAEEALDDTKAAAIAKAAGEEVTPPPVVSTATSFADGSLTDRVGWIKMAERVQ